MCIYVGKYGLLLLAYSPLMSNLKRIMVPETSSECFSSCCSSFSDTMFLSCITLPTVLIHLAHYQSIRVFMSRCMLYLLICFEKWSASQNLTANLGLQVCPPIWPNALNIAQVLTIFYINRNARFFGHDWCTQHCTWKWWRWCMVIVHQEKGSFYINSGSVLQNLW